MWETLPIQRSPGRTGTMIARDFIFHPHPEIKTDLWKNVPKNVQGWCFSIWKDEFQLRRPSMGDNDVLAWVPRIGILAAKRGHWIGTDKSFFAVAMCFNYVDRDHRGVGWSGRMITTLCRKVTDLYGPTPFMFEIQHIVPTGLQSVEPYLTFTYTWIPFISVQVPPKWTSIPLVEFKSIPGFHPNEMVGYLAFQYNGNRILLDPHNDIVFYDDLVSLYTFDGLQLPGAYCRIFSPLGTSKTYLANLYFDRPSSVQTFMLPC